MTTPQAAPPRVPEHIRAKPGWQWLWQKLLADPKQRPEREQPEERGGEHVERATT